MEPGVNYNNFSFPVAMTGKPSSRSNCWKDQFRKLTTKTANSFTKLAPKVIEPYSKLIYVE